MSNLQQPLKSLVATGLLAPRPPATRGASLPSEPQRSLGMGP